MTTPPHNPEAETSLLGAVLLGPSILPDLAVVEGLRPEHFYLPKHEAIFRSMLALHDRSEPVDALTVTGELGEHDDYVHSLPTLVPMAGHWAAYAQRIVADAGYRRRLEAGRRIMEAALARDPDAAADAEALLSEPTRAAAVTVESRQDALVDHLESGGGKVWRTPFPLLNDLFADGLRPGEFTVLGGHGSHGKSVIATQLLDFTARGQGARNVLYSNEMLPLEIDQRYVAREANIPFKRIRQARLKQEQHARFLRAVEKLPDGFQIVAASGWTAEEIARDVRRRNPDLAVIDLLNGVAGGTETKDIDHNVRVLAAVSRQAGCHLIACQHLNTARLVGRPYPLEPARSDLRGSGQIFDLANNVLFVYLAESSVTPGERSNDGLLKVEKARGAILGRVPLSFDGSRMRFIEAQTGTVAA